MKVLIGCEFTGIVRDEFRKLGHEAYSCDLLPTETNPKHHIQKDIRTILNDNWELAIFFPLAHTCVLVGPDGLRINKQNNKTH